MRRKEDGGHRNLHLALSEPVAAALDDIAAQLDISMDQLADDWLAEAIERYRQEARLVTRVRVIEQHIPDSLAGVDPSHPIFGGREPTRMTVRRRQTYN